MRHTPQQERSERMLGIILQAALQVAADRGIEHMTTRHIADRAGISVGTLYHYFANKEDVLQALENRFVADLLRDLQAATAEIVRLDIGLAVRRGALIYYDRLSSDDGRWLLLVRNMLRRGVEFTHQVEGLCRQACYSISHLAKPT